MGLKISYSKNAKQNLKEIYNYIRRDSFHYARKEVTFIREVVLKLKSEPLLGMKFAKFDDELTRELIFKDYHILYDIIGDQIHILTIHHHARLFRNNPAFKNDE